MEETSEFRDRIRELLKVKKVTYDYLARGNYSKRVVISKQLSQNNNVNVSLVTISMVLDRFPDISAEWLLRGEGSMYKNEHEGSRIYAGAGGNINMGNAGGNITVGVHEDRRMYDPIHVAELDTIITDEKVKAAVSAVIKAKDDIIADKQKTIDELRQDKLVMRDVIKSMYAK